MLRQKTDDRSSRLRFKAQVGSGIEEEFEVEAIDGRLPDREELIELILDHFEQDGELGRDADTEVVRRNRDRTHVLWNRTSKTECDDVAEIGWGDRLVVADRSTAGTAP